MADDIIEKIKAANPIEEVIEECGYSYERTTGITRRVKHSGGLVVFPRTQTFVWETQNRRGDVIDFLSQEKGYDFKTTVEFLADRAKIERPRWGKVDEKQAKASKSIHTVFSIAMDLFQKWLFEDADALAYVYGRGWTDETICDQVSAAFALREGAKICDATLEAAKAARGSLERVVARGVGIGFSGRKTAAQFKAMRDEFAMWQIDPESPAAVSILGYQGDVTKWLVRHNIPTSGLDDWIRKGRIHGMMSTPGIVYPHRFNGTGKLIYLTRRQLPGFDRIGEDVWKSFNPQALFVGQRQPFFNHLYRQDLKELIVVEGQADAITYGQWGFGAVALCGTGLDTTAALLRERHRTIYLALDNDKAGLEKMLGKDNSMPVAELMGGMCRIGVRYGEAKDANDWLVEMLAEGVSQADQVIQVRKALNNAEMLALLLAREAGRAEGDRQIDLIKRVKKVINGIDKDVLIHRRLEFARALYPDKGSPLREFNALINDKRKGDDDDDHPTEFVETFGAWLPTAEDPQKGWLIDYLFDTKENKAWLAYRNPEGEIGKAAHLDIDGKRYIPKWDENVRLGIVMMPSDIGPLKSTTELLAIHEEFHRRTFLLDNPLNYKIASFYSLFTWVHDCFNELPYLRAKGDKDTGKSAIMLRMGYICYRLARSTGISSTASLKYATHTYHATVFLDEMDVSDQFDERIVMLNIGAMKEQAYIWKMEPVKTADGVTVFEPTVSNVYGPKLITMYGSFSDPATESRCITFNVYEKEIAELRKKKIPRRMNDALVAEALAIRNMDITWRLHNWRPSFEIPEMLEDEFVSTRVNQVTLPIKYLVKDDPVALKDVTTVVRAIYEEQVMDRAASFEARILEAILSICENSRFSALGFLNQASTIDYGVAKYIRYPDLAKVANFLVDEMNSGKVKDPQILSEDCEPDESKDEESAPKKRKKKPSGITSKTIGDVCRKDLRLPVQRMGSGYVVIVGSSTQPDATSERLEVLKVKYGLSLMKKEAPAAMDTESAVQTDAPDFTQEEMDYWASVADEEV